MSEIILALVPFSQARVGLGLVLCVIFTADIYFTVLSNCVIIRSLISNSLLSDLISVMWFVVEYLELVGRDSSSLLIIYFVTLSFSKITSDCKASFELLE